MTPGAYLEPGEDKDQVMRGIAERLHSKDTQKDFAPLYHPTSGTKSK